MSPDIIREREKYIIWHCLHAVCNLINFKKIINNFGEYMKSIR